MTLAERIDELVAQHGSLRALARVMECSPPYICRLRAGVTENPGPAVLRKLGLRRVVSYERLKTHNVEFSGVPAGHSSNHPAGGASAGTQG
jgi:hypothetical protein